jgi:hypothetical protein
VEFGLLLALPCALEGDLPQGSTHNKLGRVAGTLVF